MQVTKPTKEKKTDRLKRLLREYCSGLTDSAKGFETDVFEIVVWSTYRREIGKNLHLLSEEEKLKVLEADRIARQLAEKKRNSETGLGFRQIVKAIEEYPIHKPSKTSS